jgi:hypothetical protein
MINVMETEGLVLAVVFRDNGLADEFLQQSQPCTQRPNEGLTKQCRS